MIPFSSIECVCCPEHCKAWSYFPTCHPSNPMRPAFREYSVLPLNPVSHTSYLLPNGKIKRFRQQPPVGQLDLFGGAV